MKNQRKMMLTSLVQLINLMSQNSPDVVGVGCVFW